ncbi:MAG TPA: HAD-IA family hydrolase [Blastocatellia bacterium]|nr:HAD-IA family hydrolase [Blastocatellia bacterium]
MSDEQRKFRVVLFDFDGTLVNTTPLILRSFRATWEKLFGFTLDEASYIQTFGIPLETAMQQMLAQMTEQQLIPAPADPVAAVAEMLAAYRAFNHKWHDQMIEPFAGIDQTLKELRQRGCVSGVVTSKKRVGAERGMKIFGLHEMMAVSVCCEDTTRNKPDPEPLLHAMERLAAAPEETIYVGDSPHDIIAGRAARIATAAAAWGPFARTELERFNPDFLLDEPRDLLRLC